MPFRHAFRPYSASHDVYTGMPVNEEPDQWHQQEMDYTTYSEHPIMNVSPFGMLQNVKADSDVPSLESHTSSITSTSLSDSEVEFPDSASAIAQEQMCPLIAGEVDSCQPSLCGPDAPCMNFSNLPPIEECTLIPCVTPPTSSRRPTHPATRRPKQCSSQQLPHTSTSPVAARPASSAPGPSPIDREPFSSPAKAVLAQRSRQTKREDVKPKAKSRSEAKQRAKAAHSLVEKKYRENLNTKLTQLHTVLLAVHRGPKADQEVDADFEFDGAFDDTKPATSNTKFRKSDVLTDAMKYIGRTESEMRYMEAEITRLNERLSALQKLVRYEDRAY